MSTTLSTTSRQLEFWTSNESQVQFDHSGENAPSIRGIVMCSGGGFPCGSFQTKSCLFSSSVSHDLVRAAGGTLFAYGILAQRPSPPHRQSWNGHATWSPLIVPIVRSPPMCRQYPSSTCSPPDESANTTSFVPNACTACGPPWRNRSARPRQCQPRAYRVGSGPASIVLTPSRSDFCLPNPTPPPIAAPPSHPSDSPKTRTCSSLRASCGERHAGGWRSLRRRLFD